MKYSVNPIRPEESHDWLRLRYLLWDADDHALEIARFFTGELEEPVEVLIARDCEGRAVGHVELSIRDDIDGLKGVKTGYIEGLYVEVSHRSNGLVGQFLRASEQWAKDQGCSAFASDRHDRVIIHRRFSGGAA